MGVRGWAGYGLVSVAQGSDGGLRVAGLHRGPSDAIERQGLDDGMGGRCLLLGRSGQNHGLVLSAGVGVLVGE